MKKLAFGLLASAFFMYSCGEENKTPDTDETPEIEVSINDQIMDTLDLKNENTHISFGWMAQCDSFVDANLEVLIQHTSYNADHDPTALEEAKKTLEDLKSHRFDINSIPQDKDLEKYDEAVDAKISSIIAFAKGTDGYEGYPVIQETIDTINHVNRNVLPSVSGIYLELAQDFNRYYDSLKPALDKEGISKYKRFDLFYSDSEDATTEPPVQ